MRRLWRALGRASRDAAGASTIEWALLLAAFGIPMIYVLGLLLAALAEYYRMVTFLETLPYP